LTQPVPDFAQCGDDSLHIWRNDDMTAASMAPLPVASGCMIGAWGGAVERCGVPWCWCHDWLVHIVGTYHYSIDNWPYVSTAENLTARRAGCCGNGGAYSCKMRGWAISSSGTQAGRPQQPARADTAAAPPRRCHPPMLPCSCSHVVSGPLWVQCTVASLPHSHIAPAACLMDLCELTQIHQACSRCNGWLVHHLWPRSQASGHPVTTSTHVVGAWHGFHFVSTSTC
jgi:hypothetical protein